MTTVVEGDREMARRWWKGMVAEEVGAAEGGRVGDGREERWRGLAERDDGGERSSGARRWRQRCRLAAGTAASGAAPARTAERGGGHPKPHARHAEPGQERTGVFLILLDQVERPKLHYLSLFWKRARQPNMRAWLHLFVNGESKF